MKIVMLMVVLCLCASILAITEAKAEEGFTVSGGYMNTICENVSDSPVVTLSGNYKYKLLGVELGVGAFNNDIEQVGQLVVLDYYATGKIYLNDSFYIGAGVGYYDTYLSEHYDGQADVDDELERHVVIGKEFDNWVIECQGTIADLDIETGLPYETPIESHSRLDNVQVKIGRKW